jgi:hypothetical protein
MYPFCELDWSPTEYATIMAVSHRWAHLDTAMALDPIELLFVAMAIAPDAILCPGADLDSGLFPGKPVLLTYEDISCAPFHTQ